MANKYTISIADEACVGDGLCCEHAASTFRLCGAGTSTLVAQTDLESADAPDQILAAAFDCRMGCISLNDAASGQRVWPAPLSQQALDRLSAVRSVTLDQDEWRLWRDYGGGD